MYTGYTPVLTDSPLATTWSTPAVDHAALLYLLQLQAACFHQDCYVFLRA